MTEECNISGKTKEYLKRKLNESKIKIIKLRVIEISLIITVVLSIGISVVVAATFLPPMAVTILSLSSAFLTGISARFNFQDKELEIKHEIEKFKKIKSKLDYVVSCNGDLTKEEYQQILNEF